MTTTTVQLHDPKTGAPLVEFRGVVENIRFQAKDSGFCIFVLKDEKRGSIALKGEVPPISKGVTLSGHGLLTEDPKWGPQIQIKQVKAEQPKSADAIVKYLSGGVIDGIGPKNAAAIVKYFGAEKTMDVIRNHPQRLREVPGIGPKRAAAISENARNFIHIERIMTFLLEHGLSTNMAFRIHREYGDAAMDMIKANPWILAAEIHGIGFATADRVAASLGMGGAHPGRLEAAMMHALSTNESEGHTAMKTDIALREASKLTSLPPSLPAFQQALGRLAAKGAIADYVLIEGEQRTEVLQLTKTFHAERVLAECLMQMVNGARLPWDPIRLRSAVAEEIRKLGWELSGDQNEAMEKMIDSPVCILTAGPGCGKTTLVGIMLRALSNHFPEIELALCAPTGKAAQRATESTDGIVQGKTTHRLLESDKSGKFLRDENNPIEARYIVADESSMYDVRLARSLVRAAAAGCAILWVGDIDQLPSVGSGAVLNDMIRSGRIPVARLTQIHRQAEGSRIVTNSHAVNRGKATEVIPGHDFEIHPVLTSEDVQKRVGLLMAERAGALGFSSDDVLVLTAGHKGPSGTIEMNQYLKSLLNPTPSASMTYGKTTFSVGDRVMVTRNNYDLDIRNGMMGRITDISNEDGRVHTLIEGVPVIFKRNELMDLDLGFCITIHKSQGSQAPCVILAMDKAHYMLMERSLLYTGMTRAAKHCMLVTREDSLAIAVHRKVSRERLTTLQHRLAA